MDTLRNPFDDIEVYVRNAKGPLSREYLRLLFTDTKKRIDNVYGVYLGSDKDQMIGESVLTIDADGDDVRVNGMLYAGTRGLYELLFIRIPNVHTYTDAGIHSYRRILLSTNAHKRNHSWSKRTLGNKRYKYKKIISAIIGGMRTSGIWRVRSRGSGADGADTRQCRGLPIDESMTVTDNTNDYVYWDDPNELVDRLRLLMASRAASHMGHDDEIASIVEELRENGHILN